MRYSELRQDVVSDEWVVIAKTRAKRPEPLFKKSKRVSVTSQGCPFDHPEKSGHAVIKVYGEKGNWPLQIIKNKYPALTHTGTCPMIYRSGPFSSIRGVGHHDLIITRDHHLNFPKLSQKNAHLVFKALQDRYQTLCADPCSAYISAFHNWGISAGASIYHPHYQIISLPIIPPDVYYALQGSLHYFRKNKRCVYCTMIAWEKKMKKRLVYEDKSTIVFAPFFSKKPYELRIFPKRHYPYFEGTPYSDLVAIASALQVALTKIEKHLHDPDYNFFIHTAPVQEKKKYRNYHWHIEILPKITISAGFELGTGIEINPVDPDEAAKFLRIRK